MNHSGASACVSRVAEVAEIEAAEVLVQKEAWTSSMIEQLRDTAGRSWFREILMDVAHCPLTSPIGSAKKAPQIFARIDAASAGRTIPRSATSDDARFRPSASSQRLTVNTAATIGAVSLAASTAKMVIDAITMIRTETGPGSAVG